MRAAHASRIVLKEVCTKPGRQRKKRIAKEPLVYAQGDRGCWDSISLGVYLIELFDKNAIQHVLLPFDSKSSATRQKGGLRRMEATAIRIWHG